MIEIEELKKLPNHIKMDLIDELLHSMNDSEVDEYEMEETDTEIIKEMEQRLDDMKSGKDPGYTWEEAKAILIEDMNNRKAHRG